MFTRSGYRGQAGRYPVRHLASHLRQQGFLPSAHFLERLAQRAQALGIRFDPRTFGREFAQAQHFRQTRPGYNTRIALMRGMPILYRVGGHGGNRIVLVGLLPQGALPPSVPIGAPRLRESEGEAELESMLRRVDRALAATEAEAMVYRTPPHPGTQTRLVYSNARQQMVAAIAQQRAAQARLAAARERLTLAEAQHMQQLRMAMGDFSYLDPTITREFQAARAAFNAAQTQASQAAQALNDARTRYATARRDRLQYRQARRPPRRPAREYEAMAGRTRRSRPDRVIQQLIRANTLLAWAETSVQRGATATAIEQLRRAMQALIAARAIAGDARIWASEARMRLERPSPWMQGALDAISRAREATVRAIDARRRGLGRPVSA